MNVIGHMVVKGVPYINGKRAIHDPPKPEDDPEIALLGGAFSVYRCPECKARLSGKDMICLNICHLSAASARRFHEMLAEADRRAKYREAQKEKLKKESGFLGEFVGEIADKEDFDPK